MNTNDCKPCEEKRAKLAAEEAEIAAKKSASVPQPVDNMLWVTCVCGLARILPSAVYQVGDPVELPACPRCGYPFIGTFIGDRTIQEQVR